MTTPTIYPAQFNPSIGDVFAKAPALRNGAVQAVEVTVSVPSSTATSTVIGLMPFNKGARIHYDSRLLTADLDSSTNVTLDVGYVYDDNTTYTNDPNAFVAASTTAQTGGIITFSATAGFQFIAEADGWVAVTTGGGSTTTTGNIQAELMVSYDASAVIS